MIGPAACALALLLQVPSFELRDGDRLAIVGNALAERLLHEGTFEARLRLARPDVALTVRNLGFAGDEVGVRQRTAGFGTPDEHLDRVEASVVVLLFGYVESFRGPDGVPAFRDELARHVDHLRAPRGDGREPRRVVLVAPIPCEDLGDPLLPDARAENARIALYGAAIESVAREKSVPFVDVRAAMEAAYAHSAEPLTIDGAHLDERGNAAFGAALARALVPDAEEPDPARLARVRALVAAKDARWFRHHHVADGYNVYGERSLLAYKDGQTNREVMQRELEWLAATCQNLDREIDEAVRGLAPGSLPRVAVPALIPVPTNRPGEGPNGAHRFLSGQEAIGRLTPGAGLDVNLFADEARFPELANPVQMSFDTAGRLWVAVWPSYPNARPDEPARDKLLVLEDQDGDGRADSCRAFVSDLHNPTGFEFWNGGVFVATAPELLFLADTNGDGVADRRERVLQGLASADTHHASNSFVLGPEGALYFQEGIFHRTQVETVHGVVRQKDGCVWRYEPRTRRLERHVAYGFLNPHGHVFDRWGQDFVTDGTGNENFFALPISGFLEAPAQHPYLPPFLPQRSRPAGGTELVSGAHFPPDMQGDYLIANVIGFQGIFRYGLRDAGSGFGADEREPLVFSADPNFRPVDLEIGPDGALYFLDWHNPLIGHMQHHLRDPSRDQVHGRVYRVTARGRPLAVPTAIAGRPVAELVELLKSPEDRVRYRARIELSARPSRDVAAAARAFERALDPRDVEVEHHRLEALWLLTQHAVLDRPILGRVLASPEPRARAAATRVVRHMRRVLGDDVLALLAARITDEHPRVRLEALVALSYLPQAAAAETALRVLRQPMDANLTYALTETMRALEPHWRAALDAGAPLAADNPPGEAWLLARAETEALLTRPSPGAALFEELLTRYDLEPEHVEAAARGLAAIRGTTAAAELAAAIGRADLRDDGHADHRLAVLFSALPRLGSDLESPILAELAQGARRAATRRLAIAAGIRDAAQLEAAWERRAARPEDLVLLLDALPHVRDESVRRAAFPRVLAAFDAEPATPHRGVRGRFVRVELPGSARTLTLAEVEVLSGDRNVAPRGTASQASTNWGGVASRAIDGNASGRWADGGQSHTIEDRADPWWELDLGAELALDRVIVSNRTDEQFGRRLDGAVVRVLDGERRSTAEHVLAKAGPVEKVEFADPALELRRAAARALPGLARDPEHAAAASTSLARQAFDADLGAASISALRAIGAARWAAGLPGSIAGALAERLSGPSGRAADRLWLALADDLARTPALEVGAARALAAARRRAGPKVVVIRPVPDSLTYDVTRIAVAAGRPLEIVFENVDIMPHNLVVAAPGALAKVGLAAEAMSASPDAWARAFVPDMPEVLHASKLLQPGRSETIAFVAPGEPGDYPYVCTFPGHWIRMNGVLRVCASEDEAEREESASALPAAAAKAPAPPARAFVRDWKPAEFAGDLTNLAARDPARGRAVVEAASCLACHAVDGAGGRTGPDLREVARRYSPAELLAHVLEPSRTIAPEYVAVIVSTTDGALIAGRITAEDDRRLVIQVDPYGGQTVEVAKDEVDERASSTVSIMPSGLLSTFQKAEVLDLIAWLAALR
ncbi:MAG: discoidin domain-containing protein [Planctomycetes bacterium]|nr:discoidin domain-containing protein [Planctomycetota bacterium]